MGNQIQIRKRHFIIDHCLRDHTHEYTLEDLLVIVNDSLAELGQRPVSERQLYNDISFFQSQDGYGAEMETYRIVRADEKGRNRSYVAYRYADPNYSIRHLNLPEMQLRFFRNAIGSMIKTGSSPFQQWLSSHYQKMVEINDGFTMDDSVMLEFNPFLGGSKAKEFVLNFEKIYTGIVEHRSLNVKVSTFAYGQIDGCLHPFMVKQYNRRWYALGVLEDDHDRVRVLPIDMVETVEFSTVPYFKYPFNPEEYFEDIVGVFNPNTPVLDVHLRFRGWMANHLEFNPLHGSQRCHWETVEGEKVLDVHLSVKHNLELEGMLMRCTGMMEVLGPEEIVEVYNKHLKQACMINGIKID